MTATTMAPSTAERVRSACAINQDAVLAIDGTDPTPISLHHLQANGDVAIAVPQRSAADIITRITGGLPAVLEVTDRSPLPLREPVRSLVWLRGTLHRVCESHTREIADEVASEFPSGALLELGHSTVLLILRVSSAVVADASGAEPVSVDDLICATPDPFWEVEAAWLQHLDSDHRALIDMLSRKLPPHLRRGSVRPLAITRYGLRLRVEDDSDTAGGDRDVWMPFAGPVSDATELSRALRTLVGCPFVNGLRARQ
ncbi:MAG: DUF2470 domain-containing protein [Rhodococcus sp.]|nr:DUF2470 domain-containing protein [Rhodococcus sp. (in: high G+C Gram-positive bacteria)]